MKRIVYERLSYMKRKIVKRSILLNKQLELFPTEKYRCSELPKKRKRRSNRKSKYIQLDLMEYLEQMNARIDTLRSKDTEILASLQWAYDISELTTGDWTQVISEFPGSLDSFE